MRRPTSGGSAAAEAIAQSSDPSPQSSLEVVRFGRAESLDVDPAEVVTFPRGLVGMGDARRFVAVEDPRIEPFRWLQSLDDPELAFVVVDPEQIIAEYTAEITAEDAQQLRLERAEEAELWAIVTIDAEPAHSTVNLLAPVVIHREAKLGKQIILSESPYALRHPLVAW